MPMVMRYVKLLLALVVVYWIYLATNLNMFERFLNRLYITFDDFPLEYAKELKNAQTEGRAVEFDYAKFAPNDPSTQIPKKIHFIWFANLYHEHLDISEIPSHGSDAPKLCKQYNPDFEVITWNATGARALMEEHYSWFMPTYDAYRYPIQRIDAFKYFVMLHHGGVYMDLDIACRRSLAPLIEYPAWWPRASPMGINNDLMASRAGHPIVEYMTKSLVSRNVNLFFPYVTIFWSTGPQFTTDILRKWFNKGSAQQYTPGSSKKLADKDDFFVLPQDFYSEKYTFFGHSPGGTWHGADVAVVLWLVDHPYIFAVIPVVIFAVFMCALRLRRTRRLRDAQAKFRSDE